MSAKHTPGPWESWGLLVGNIYSSGGKELIARCGGLRFKKKPNSVIEANARLIAASPELLDALRAMVEMMDNGDVSDTGWAKEWDQAKAAIAKATGVANEL